MVHDWELETVKRRETGMDLEKREISVTDSSKLTVKFSQLLTDKLINVY